MNIKRTTHIFWEACGIGLNSSPAELGISTLGNQQEGFTKLLYYCKPLMMGQ